MASDNIRVYAVLDLGAARTLPQIGNLRNQAVTKPLISRVVQYGNSHDQPHNKFNAVRISTSPANRYIWIEFELDIADVDAAQTLIDAQCTARSIVQPNYQLRIQALLLAEVQEAGLDLGFGAAVTNTFAVSIVGFGPRDTAIQAAITNMIANCTQWGDC